MRQCHFLIRHPWVDSSTALAKVSQLSFTFLHLASVPLLRIPISHTFLSLPDMFTVDEQLNYSLSMYIVTLFSVFSTFVVISGVTPIFAFCLIPMCLFYTWQQSYFTVREAVLFTSRRLRFALSL
jgi:hypothetical protein